jgi:hypothetical protein
MPQGQRGRLQAALFASPQPPCAFCFPPASPPCIPVSFFFPTFLRSRDTSTSRILPSRCRRKSRSSSSILPGLWPPNPGPPACLRVRVRVLAACVRAYQSVVHCACTHAGECVCVHLHVGVHMHVHPRITYIPKSQPRPLQDTFHPVLPLIPPFPAEILSCTMESIMGLHGRDHKIL